MSHQNQSWGTLNVWCHWKYVWCRCLWPLSMCPQLLGRLGFPPKLYVILHLFESGLWLKFLETKAGLKCDLNCVRNSEQLAYSAQFLRDRCLFLSQPYGTCNLWLPCIKKKKAKMTKKKSAYVTTLNIWCFLILSSVSTMYLFDSLDHSGPK